MKYDRMAMRVKMGQLRRIATGDRMRLNYAFYWQETPQGWAFWAERFKRDEIDDEAAGYLREMIAEFEADDLRRKEQGLPAYTPEGEAMDAA